MNFTRAHSKSAAQAPLSGLAFCGRNESTLLFCAAAILLAFGALDAARAQQWIGAGSAAGGTGVDYYDVNNWSSGTVGADFSTISTSAVVQFEGGTTVSASNLNLYFTSSGVNFVLGNGTLLSGTAPAQINLSGNVNFSNTKGNVTTLGGVNLGMAGVGSDLVINLSSGTHNFQYGGASTGTGNASVLIVNAQLTGSGGVKSNYASGNPTVVYTNNNNSYTGAFENAGNTYYTSIANAGYASSLGKANYISAGNGSVLAYIGTTNQSSNKVLTFNSVGTGGVTISNLGASGNTTLEFTGAATTNGTFSGALNMYASTGNKLIYSGALATSNGYGVYVNYNNASTTVSTTGDYSTAATDGVVALTGANVHGGKTQVNNGTLSINTIANGSAATTSIVTTNGSADITVGSTTGLAVGQTVFGTGIPTGATIVAINGNVVTLSAAATATSPVTYTTPGYLGGTANSLGVSTSAAGNLVINGNVTAPGNATLQYTGGAASTDRLFTIGGNQAGATGTIDASGTGLLNFTNTGSVAYGTANQTRGVILTGTGSGNLSPVIGNNGTAAVSLTKNGTGVWSLAGNNTYTGATLVTEGTLAVNGRIASGSAVAVSASGNNNAVLTGTGTIAGNVTVGNGVGAGISELAAGGIGSIGTLNTGAVTFGTNSQYVFELNSTTAIPTVDLLQVNGLLTLNNTFLLGSDLYTGANLLSEGTVLILAQYTSLSGIFNGLADGSYLDIGNNRFQINYGTLSGYANEITLEVVPEPTAFAALLGSLGLLYIARRRKCEPRA